MGQLHKKKDPKKKQKQRQEASGKSENSGKNGDSKKVVSLSSIIKDKSKLKSSGVVKTVKNGQAPNFITKSIQFLREVNIELRKVAWPTRKQAVGSTAVVIVLVFIISMFLGVVDFGLGRLVRLILQ